MNESCILDERYTISGSQVSNYQRDGHLFLPQLLPSNVMPSWRQVISKAVDHYNTETRPLAERDTYGKAFLQVFNLWTRDEAVRRFVLARRFAWVAAELMGVERVRIYHDQALFKEPGGGITPWHQDQYYWPLDTRDTITMWIPLADVEEGMGMMEFVSGTHREAYIANQAISDASEAFYREYIGQHGHQPVGAKTARAGDASFHAGWTLHRAMANQSSKRREVMTVIYFADGARIDNPIRDETRGDLKAWLDNLPEGSLANSSLNPVV